MSRPYEARQIINCPMCPVRQQPAHIGHGVMVCQGCGAHFRVVHAEPRSTGRRLGEIVKCSVEWAKQSEGK